MTAVDLVQRALGLVADFLASLTTGTERGPAASGLPVAVLALVLEAATRVGVAAGRAPDDAAVVALDRALGGVRSALSEESVTDRDLRRTWHLVSVMTACVRGMLADGLLTDPRRFRAINDEDFLDWIIRHGASPEVADFAFIRGLYDLVFADGGADRARRGVSAGVAVFMTSKMFFEYQGAIFWKMAAGMGDVVFAPMYEALRRRGVRFEFFHRVDRLHLSADRTMIDAVTVGRQAHLARGHDQYEPLVRVGDLPVFPHAPLVSQLAAPPEIVAAPLESHWCAWPDAEVRTLRRGEDFDVVVLAIPVGMTALIARELIDDRPEWRAMVDHVATTATQALQLWLRDDEPTLGWGYPGATVSAYAQPFNTWASMDQLRAVEQWPATDRPGTIAYFCGALDAPWPPDVDGPRYPERERRRVHEHAMRFVTDDLPQLLPGTANGAGFRWEQLCGADGAAGTRRPRIAAVPREHRPVGPVRALRAGNRPVPAASGRERLRQPRPRRRLDRQRTQRGLHRGRHDVGPPGGKRGARPATTAPHRRHLPRLSVTWTAHEPDRPPGRDFAALGGIRTPSPLIRGAAPVARAARTQSSEVG